jgi:hypothetical protein
MESADGKYSIEIQGSLIYTKLSESFNHEGISLWINEMKEAINSLNGHSFIMLVDELSATGATPEALELANHYNKWLNSQALKAKAVVYSSKIYREIDISKLTARKEQNIAFFDNISDAKIWLQQYK